VNELFSQTDLLELVKHDGSPCLSFYFPTQRAGRSRQQEEVRHRILRQRAERELSDQGFDGPEIAALLHEVDQLFQRQEMWQHRSKGLAVFASPRFFRCFSLPLQVAELTVVGDRFLVAPLLPMLLANGRYFILALTEESADLFEATRETMAEVDIPDSRYSESEESQRTTPARSHSPTSRDNGNRREALDDGQTGPSDQERNAIADFFARQVDPDVVGVLQDQHAPLVLACVDGLAAMYHNVNSYEFLAETHVSGDPETIGEEELLARAWRLVKPSMREMEQRALERFAELAVKKRTATLAKPIVEAARSGRIETLLLSTASIRKRFATAGKSERWPASYAAPPSLVDEVTEQTLLHGGDVLAVEEVPGPSTLAAVLRY
jgi:Bacterial archaeo-eukaryotic release factor family 3